MFDVDDNAYKALVNLGGDSIVRSNRSSHSQCDIEEWCMDNDVAYVFLGNYRMADVWHVHDKSHRMEFILRWS